MFDGIAFDGIAEHEVAEREVAYEISYFFYLIFFKFISI